jgi:hypothetical protein
MIDRHQAVGPVLDQVIAHRLRGPVGETVGHEGKAGVLDSATNARKRAGGHQVGAEYTTRNVPHVVRRPLSRE